ncbi:MAG: type II toxin-antitoxin system HigB family toxin [Cytophagaceae bacterium]|nr:MAG: type II toxin-antitoxin system HigB family toxin [Cytophagaceae bacterium]
MVIISYAPIRDFTETNPAVGDALEAWYFTCKAADWKSFADVRRSFNTVDFVGNDRYVFNIKGNHYRLVAMIFFSRRTIFIRFVGTHREYDAIDVTTV